MAMKCPAASRVVGPSPGRHSSGVPNSTTECVVTVGVPSDSSNCAAMSQLCTESRR